MNQNRAGPLLSIVVPTRNRYPTLKVIVGQFLSWESQDFELVIEDNSDDTSGIAALLVRYQSDQRLRYLHHEGPRSAIENCDAAIARADGQVLTFIGDDDSVTQHCIQAARWMIDSGVEALICGVAGYTWPDMEHAVAINKLYNGKLAAFEAIAMTRPVQISLELDALAEAGAQRMGMVPRLYQALVQKAALDRLKEGLGTYFPGPVPDMANAVSLSKYLNNCYYTDVPLVVAGQSKNSMSGKNSVRKHQGDLLKEKSLPADTAERWDPRIPRYWSAPTIWAEAAIKGAEATQQIDFLKSFSFARVYANCFAFNERIYYPLIIDAMRQNGKLAMVVLWPRVLWYLGLKTVERAINLAKKMAFGVSGWHFQDVADATRHVESVIKEDQLMAGLLSTQVSPRELTR
jgi:hypothetical protein